MQAQPVGFDDLQILPTHQKQKKVGPAEYAPGEEFNEEFATIGEPISNENLIVAQPLIDFFGESAIRKIFSRTWTLREKGILEIEKMS